MSHSSHRKTSRRLMRTCSLLTLLVLAPSETLLASHFSRYLELRVYPVEPSRQERFLEFFEEHYLESQEVVGMRIWGQFLDLDAPEHFVWLRGYRSMEERAAGLRQFYTSPVWAETGQEAVSMLTGRARHVHFLEPVTEADAFAESSSRPLLLSEYTSTTPGGIVVAEVFRTDGDLDALAEEVRSTVASRYEASGAPVLGLFRSSEQENNFPLLPFIEDEPVVVLFTSFETREHYEAAFASVTDAPERLESFVLRPGQRSRLAHRADD